MQKISDQGRLRPWMGFVLFGVLMAFMIFAAYPLQTNFGILGLILTELGFLALAVGYCLIRKVKIREVFPVKKISIRDLAGSILLVIGVYPLAIISVAVMGLIFPSSAAEAGEISSFVYDSLNYPMAVLVIALLPAICEEAIHRGAILSSFRGIKHDWVILLIMSLLFGINHLTVLRFLFTAILGLILSYVVVKKNNILLSVIMHFTNNLISVSLGYLTGGADASAAVSVDYTSVLGVYMIIGFLSPVIITIALMLLNPESFRKIRFLYAGVLATVMLFSGFGITSYSSSTKMILNTTISYLVTADDRDCSMIDFDIEEERKATVIVVLTEAEGDYMISIDGDKGSNIINAEIPEGTMRMITYDVVLQADHYTVTVMPGEKAVGEHPNISITIR
ncbi:MAG: CPBP family intramembrane metalloprotease [Saccharofermentans sp.]|nr:CPBP family intramembrane metalloprotease [Saccharofermentans sp.]